MAQYLPFVLQQLCGRPHALSEDMGNMIVAALSGRMDIRSLVTESETYDARSMRDLAEMGRVSAIEAADKDRPSLAAAQSELRYFEDQPYRLTPSGIAIVPVKGVLKRSWGIGPFSGATGYDGIMTQVLHAEENDAVKAMWFDGNSGGGTTDGLFDLTDTIYSTSARFGGKPKVFFAGDYAASAAYAIAAACDEVYTPELGMVGSIGTIMIHAEVSRMLENEGIAVTMIRSRDRKARGGPNEVLDAETLREFQEICDEADAVFTRAVGRYRPALTENVVSEMAGRVYTGNRALAAGLINGVKSEPVAWMELEQRIAQS